MKTFKEFQKESYSRLDENWGNILTRAGGAWLGKDAYDTVGPDIRKVMPGKDGKKIKSTKSNWKGQVLGGIVGGAGDKVWKHVAKPALTGVYNVGKFGVTKVLPWAFSQVFKPPGP